MRPEFRRVIKRKDIVDFEELTPIGKDSEAEWATMRDGKPHPAPETSFLPEFAYKGEETWNMRASLAAMDAHFEENCPPRQKSPRPGRKIRDNYAQRLPSANKPEQNAAKINVGVITQALSTSTRLYAGIAFLTAYNLSYDCNFVRSSYQRI